MFKQLVGNWLRQQVVNTYFVGAVQGLKGFDKH